MRVLGISGSLRRDSYNTALLRHAGELFEAEGAEFEIYRGLRDIPPYDEDYDTEGAPDAVSRIREAVRDADAVFFVTRSTTRRSPAFSRTHSTGCHDR